MCYFEYSVLFSNLVSSVLTPLHLQGPRWGRIRWDLRRGRRSDPAGRRPLRGNRDLPPGLSTRDLGPHRLLPQRGRWCPLQETTQPRNQRGAGHRTLHRWEFRSSPACKTHCEERLLIHLFCNVFFIMFVLSVQTASIVCCFFFFFVNCKEKQLR